MTAPRPAATAGTGAVANAGPVKDAGGQRQYVCYVTKGLADVAAGELAGLLPPGAVGPPEERFVLATATAAAADAVLAGARTVDDFRLLVAGPCRVTGEADFRELCAAAAERTRTMLADQPSRTGTGCAGPGGGQPWSVTPWSVTLSARRPPWSDGSWQPGQVIAATMPGTDLTARRRAPVDLRIQADGEVMHVALNLAGQPPGKRPDRVGEAGGRPGALRPTVAAAMLRLALAARPVPAGSPAAGGRSGPPAVYDPCAGTGTIPAEAMALGLPVYASDIDPQAVRLTRERLARVGLTGARQTGVGLTGQRLTWMGQSRPGAGRDEAPLAHRVFTHDVRSGLPGRVPAGLVVSNLPWGKQVAVPSRQELFDGIAQVVRGAVAAGGAAVLLSTHEQQLRARLARALPGARLTGRRIGLLGQSPVILTVGPG